MNMRNYPYIDKLVLAGNVAGYLIACMIVGEFLPLLSAPALTGIILGAAVVVGPAVAFVIIEENKKQKPKGHILNKDLVSQIQDNFKSKNIFELKEILSEQDLSQYSYEAFEAVKTLIQTWESNNQNNSTPERQGESLELNNPYEHMDRDKISYLQEKYESTVGGINAINRKNNKLSTWKKINYLYCWPPINFVIN